MEEISKEKAIDLITEAFKDVLTKENTKSFHNGNIFNIHEEDMKRVDVMSKLFDIFSVVSMKDGICVIGNPEADDEEYNRLHLDGNNERNDFDDECYTSFKVS